MPYFAENRKNAQDFALTSFGIGCFVALFIYMAKNEYIHVAILFFVICFIVSIVALTYGYIFLSINKLKNPIKSICYGLIILVLGIIGYYSYSPIKNLVSAAYFSLTGEDQIDSYLAEYKFEEARKANSANSTYDKSDRAENLKKITIAESKFWADKGEIDRALTIVDESWSTSDYSWPEADWQEWRFNIIDKGVTSSCEKGDYKQAKLYALKASNELNVDGFKIGSGTGRYLDNKGVEHKGYSQDWIEIKAKGPSMRETLQQKISEYEKLSN